MHIATRHYDDRHPVTHEWFDLQDRLYRKPDGEFALSIAGELPGDPPVVKTLNLPEVFEWLRECPEQIERAVVDGGCFRESSRVAEHAADRSCRVARTLVECVW